MSSPAAVNHGDVNYRWHGIFISCELLTSNFSHRQDRQTDRLVDKWSMYYVVYYPRRRQWQGRVFFGVRFSPRLLKIRCTKLDIEMLYYESWKPIYFGIKRSKVKVTMHRNCRCRFLHSCECYLLLLRPLTVKADKQGPTYEPTFLWRIKPHVIRCIRRFNFVAVQGRRVLCHVLQVYFMSFL